MRTGERRAGFLALLIGSGIVVSGGLTRSAAQADTASQPSQRIELDRLDDPAGLEQRLRRLLRTRDAPLVVPNGQVQRGDFQLGAGTTVPGHLLVLEGDAELSGRVDGNVVVLDGDLILQPAALVSGDALVIGGRILDRGGGRVQGERRALTGAGLPDPGTDAGAPVLLVRLAGLAGVMLTLALLGFGLVLFARPQLEVVSDTAANSGFRSFFAGLLAQIVAIPTAGLLIAGLVLSLVGILLIPFVAIAIPLALAAAILVGLLAVAHAMGESHVRRRMAAGAAVGSPNSYRYLLIGLGGIAAVWLAWVGFGWVPVAGALVFWCAVIASWVVVTTGLGAFLLSRGGQRPAFTGRVVPPEALTDEYLWATPQLGVTAVKRPAPRSR